jgi:peptidoglycan hydrolase-like protein with peptidoglycan-binding domain
MDIQKYNMHGIAVKIVAVLAVLIMSTASTAHALTSTEILAEISRLTAVADTIRAQLRALGADPDAATQTTGCFTFSRPLAIGSSGSDVSGLQSFLLRSGLVSADSVTGYFGAITQNAVIRYQSSRGLNATGVVDISLAQTMNASCTLGTTTTSTTTTNTTTQQTVVGGVDTVSFSVNPKVGTAPLLVTALFAINGTTCTAYSIDWGDGTQGVSREGGVTNCLTDNINRQLAHTYTNRGTYTITFRSIRGFLQNAPAQYSIQVVAQ